MSSVANQGSNQKSKGGKVYETKSSGNSIKGSQDSSRTSNKFNNGGAKKLGKGNKHNDKKKGEKASDGEEWPALNSSEKVQNTNGDSGGNGPLEKGESSQPKVSSPVIHDNGTVNETKMNFASVVGTNVDTVSKNLDYVPTIMNEEGREVVVFDEIIVQEGCKKWEMTLCGHFVGYRMQFNETKYHIMRMWRKYGWTEVFMNNSGVYFLKFSRGNEIDYIVDNGPWMINSKPLFVQKWSPEVCVDMTRPTRLPLWIKLWNLPLEAWSVKGISAIASRIGKPMMMDYGTAKMCSEGKGRTGFARILVEVDACKEMVDIVEICYQDASKQTTNTKYVKAEWKRLTCSQCHVFGHSIEKCEQSIKTTTVEKVPEVAMNKGTSDKAEDRKENDGFKVVRNKRYYEKQRYDNNKSYDHYGNRMNRWKAGMQTNRYSALNGGTAEQNEKENMNRNKGKAQMEVGNCSNGNGGESEPTENTDSENINKEEVQEDSEGMAQFIIQNEYGGGSEQRDQCGPSKVS